LELTIRKPSLEEWFLIHQLRHIKKNHFHLPFYLTIDISKLAKFYEKKNEKIPITALLIKASALMAKKNPEVNRIVFRTFYGIRIFNPSYISVNLPIMIRSEGKSYLAATVLENADEKTILEINKKIKESLGQSLSDLKIGKFVYNRANNFFNRLRLRLIHFLVNHFPKIHENFGGGAIAVSSLMNHNHEDFDMSMMAYGPTGFTIGSCHLSEKDNKHLLKVGIAYDHFAFSGEKAIEASKDLSLILTGNNEEDFLYLTL
jgi:hypothetical protein